MTLVHRVWEDEWGTWHACNNRVECWDDKVDEGVQVYPFPIEELLKKPIALIEERPEYRPQPENG